MKKLIIFFNDDDIKEIEKNKKIEIGITIQKTEDESREKFISKLALKEAKKRL